MLYSVLAYCIFKGRCLSDLMSPSEGRGGGGGGLRLLLSVGTLRYKQGNIINCIMLKLALLPVNGLLDFVACFIACFIACNDILHTHISRHMYTEE